MFYKYSQIGILQWYQSMVLAQPVDIITMPTFLPPVQSKEERQQDHLPFGDYFREWQSKGEDFKAALPFKYYCQLREDERKWNNEGSRTQSSKLHIILEGHLFP